MTEVLFASLSELAEIDAISGDERPMARHLALRLRSAGLEVSGDAAGNLYALRRAPNPGPTLLIAAHTDEIGLMVKSIDPSGYIRFEKVGGVLDNLLPARFVRLRGVTGVIGVKAGHYQSEQERQQGRRHTEMYIDIGCQSAAEVMALGIQVGDPIAFISPVTRIGHSPHLVAGKAVDNRLGCAVLMQLLLGEVAPVAGVLVAAFTVQEEVGLKGAGVAAARWRPDLSLALDTMPSGDTPDMSLQRDLNIAIGRGPAIQVMSGQNGRGNLLHPVVREFLCQTAAEEEVPIQLCAFTGGQNDSSAMAWAAEGIPAGSITLPRRYSHSPVEMADLRDAAQALRLLEGVLVRMDRLPTFTFLAEQEKIL